MKEEKKRAEKEGRKAAPMEWLSANPATSSLSCARSLSSSVRLKDVAGSSGSGTWGMGIGGVYG